MHALRTFFCHESSHAFCTNHTRILRFRQLFLWAVFYNPARCRFSKPFAKPSLRDFSLLFFSHSFRKCLFKTFRHLVRSFSHAEFGENFVYQIIADLFPDNPSQRCIGTHQINRIKILRHIIINTVHNKLKTFLSI